MYAIIVGGGKVGHNLARELKDMGHEFTLIEQNIARFRRMEKEFEHAALYGDATELWVLERAGISRADLVIAVTGDDEDNMLICQVAKEKYLCERIVARANNPRNVQHFKLLGISPVVSATDIILRLIEHEVPHAGLLHLLDLGEDKLEIIEMTVAESSPADGSTVADVNLPEGALIISIITPSGGFVPKADTVIEAGQEVLVVLDPGLEERVSALFGAHATSEPVVAE
jgi:trk system potassium uptake protein TrkA